MRPIQICKILTCYKNFIKVAIKIKNSFLILKYSLNYGKLSEKFFNIKVNFKVYIHNIYFLQVLSIQLIFGKYYPNNHNFS